MNRDRFWLTDEEFSKIEPHLPTDTRGKARVDDRRVISGIVYTVLASLPIYVAISAIVTPAFRHRLNEKFARRAENQAFLVEAVSVETLKAMAAEPHMQRRWEEQLASYVQASFRTQTLANVGSQAVQFVNKATIVLTLYFGAKAVILGEMTVGELVAFNMLAAA